MSAEYLRSRTELGKPSDCLEPRLAWGWQQRDVLAQPTPQAPCLAQGYPTSSPRLSTKPRAPSARAPTALAPRNVPFVNNMS